jgi:hypothetical protein
LQPDVSVCRVVDVASSESWAVFQQTENKEKHFPVHADVALEAYIVDQFDEVR